MYGCTLFMCSRQSTFSHPHIRALCSNMANKTLLAKLRRQTGYTFAACKEALLKHDNDLNKASAWLTEEAVRRGWDKAGKLSGRTLSQGLLGLQFSRTHAVVVEVNCETDFVARNEQFQNFVAVATEMVMREFVGNNGKSIWNSDELMALTIPNSAGTVSDNMAVAIGAIGENMAIRRAVGLRTSDIPDCTSRLASYIHISTAGIRPSIRDVKFGKYAAVVRYRPAGNQPASPAWQERASRLGEQLCQHIVGMNPRPGLEITEPAEDPEEEQCLLLQPFFLDENIRVGEHLTRNDMILEDFIRVECGQEDEPPVILQKPESAHTG
ncbi:putative translation elongation factor Ts, partial [Opisthorchis viverrini]